MCIGKEVFSYEWVQKILHTHLYLLSGQMKSHTQKASYSREKPKMSVFMKVLLRHKTIPVINCCQLLNEISLSQ